MKKIYYCFIILFFILCSAPFWSMSFYKENSKYTENRSLAAFPKFSIQHIKWFINGMNSYIFDHHAFRAELSEAYMSFVLDALHESPIPYDIALGKDGWYFLGNINMDTFNESLGLVPVDMQIVERSCRNIEQMKLFCDSMGIGFYFAVAPNKERMYDRYLSLEGNKRPRFKEVMTNHLKEKYNIAVIDMGEYIYPIKDSVQMYFKTDSHWNNYGGFLGAKKLTDVIAKDYKMNAIQSNDYTITASLLNRNGDLTNALKIHPQDNDFTISSKTAYQIERSEIAATQTTPNVIHIKNNTNPNLANAIIFRDSFFSAAISPFSSSLHQSTYIWISKFDRKMVMEEIAKTQVKPDFILFEVVERNLHVFEFN